MKKPKLTRDEIELLIGMLDPIKHDDLFELWQTVGSETRRDLIQKLAELSECEECNGIGWSEQDRDTCNECDGSGLEE